MATAKTVLITGASSGIGHATADLMARAGWNVAATSRDITQLAVLTVRENVAAFPLDVTREASVAAAVDAAVQRFGTIDVVVNNAGYGVFGPLEGTPVEEVEQQFRTNVLGALAVIRHVMPIMRAKRDGTIVNVSSIGGRTAAPFASLYHASKFALEGFSESFRYEASLHGIRIKVVEPGHVKTGFISRSLKLMTHPAYETALDNYMAWVHEEDRTAPSPGPVAEAIFRAADDRSNRLRHPVGSAGTLALTRWLPDSFWRPLLAAGMTRRPKTNR